MYTHEEIAPGIHQFRFFDGVRGLGFNQYLVAADEPAIVGTGSMVQFDALWAALDEVIDPVGVRWLVVPHFEADEAGAVRGFQERCAAARPVCAAVAARQLVGFGLAVEPKVVSDDDTLDLGGARLRFIAVPWEMHLWPGMIALEETRGVLFSSDLFGQRLDPTAERPADLATAMVEMTRGSVPVRELRDGVYARLAELPIQVVAPGHGFALAADGSLNALAARVEAAPVSA